ncbi:hypothetical protein GGTG_01483 [Gaeumannomyces tritici R3-111a-1]|uniref:Uncharacterized protein n=1 Tax=Gaeumannomyces tritici (strain R3-111a-1) TaxID=644352 RepID=J3NJQ3_GAET3|nr:hypothetical protein GGTG_01483 [Gaeumannomyces tritici R3-111a-1]EJT81505.1 hypothetical protein GGTG_01483 [Gaeumannomyces tritici R3-111a-1]
MGHIHKLQQSDRWMDDREHHPHPAVGGLLQPSGAAMGRQRYDTLDSAGSADSPPLMPWPISSGQRRPPDASDAGEGGSMACRRRQWKSLSVASVATGPMSLTASDINESNPLRQVARPWSPPLARKRLE